MQQLKINTENIHKAVDFLKQGKIVIHPTDTCYGLAVDITNQKAVEKVYALKKMSAEKPISILVSDLKMLAKYGKLDFKTRKIAEKYLPEALTLILPKTENVPQFYAKNTNFVGIRIPKHTLSLKLAKLLQKPITTTSANLTGFLQAYSPNEVKKYFQNEDVVLLDGGILPKKKPSTIVKIADGKMEIIRQGELFLT